MKKLFILTVGMVLLVGCTTADWNNFARSFEQGYNAGATNPYQPAWGAAVQGGMAGAGQAPQQQYIMQQQNLANQQRQQIINEMQRQNYLIQQHMQQQRFNNYYRRMTTPAPAPTTTYTPLWGMGN